jgi:calcyphosin
MNNSISVLEILDKVKTALKRRGSKTIAGLGRTFRALDSYDGNKKVDSQEFNVGLRENGVDLTQEESDALLAFFDKDGDGCINFDEFLVGIRGQLNERREAIVMKAFLKFDKNCSGEITVEDLADVYRVDMHPKYISGEKTKEEILIEFLENFGDKNKDGKITKSEWKEYYAAVSSNIDNDDHFILLMRNAWQLD